MGEDVINRVHRLAEEEVQLLVAENFKYEWRTGNEIVYDDEGNDTYDEVNELLQTNRRDTPLLQVDNENCDSDHSDSDDDDEDKNVSLLLQRVYDSDSDSDNDADEDDHEENMDDTVNNIETVENNEELGANTECVMEDTDTECGGNETIREDVTEDDTESIAEMKLNQPTVRRSRRPGLRNSTKPPGSHRNRYEKEFNYTTTSTKKHKTV